MKLLPKSVFTYHAYVRLRERFKITDVKLLELLNTGMLGMRLGISRETHLIHRLLWSEEDQDHIVVVQNVVNGEILTLLTVDMYRRDYPTQLSDKKLKKAKNQYKHLYPSPVPELAKKPSISAFFRSEADGVVFYPLGKWHDVVPLDEIKQLGLKEGFWRWVWERVAEKEIPFDDLLYASGGYSIWDRVRIEKPMS